MPTSEIELLEVHGCDYSDYNGWLKDAAEDWQYVTGRHDIQNRKDWEFIAMAQFFMQHSAVLNGLVLDTACGRESLVDWLADKAETVVATDYWQPAYLAAANIKLEDFLTFWKTLPNVYPMVMDTTRMHLHDNTFDATFCVSSIEHIGSEDGFHGGSEQAIREMIRVTKPGGLIAFSTEMHPDETQDKWYFTRMGLAQFIGRFQLTASPTVFDVKTPDGSDEKFGIHPVAFAFRKR